MECTQEQHIQPQPVNTLKHIKPLHVDASKQLIHVPKSLLPNKDTILNKRLGRYIANSTQVRRGPQIRASYSYGRCELIDRNVIPGPHYIIIATPGICLQY